MAIGASSVLNLPCARSGPAASFTLTTLMGRVELPLNFNVNDREFNPLVFVPVVFAAIGLYALLKAIRDTLRVRKFGATTLEAGPAKPGGRFEGRLRTSDPLRQGTEQHL